MSRSLSLITACALALVFCSTGRGQDSPSLGDVARKAQKDKANRPQAKVITNDDMPSGSGGISSALGSGPGRVIQPGSTGKPDEMQSPAEGLEKLQSVVDQLDSLDRATLVSNALGGNDTNFPGRAKWEEKLLAAKQTLVSQTRALLQKARQLEASAEGMKDVQDPNDPRVKSISAKVQQLVQESQQNSAAFQAVITEGKDLAAQQAAH
jgi:lysophospholipase L1-like esterase